MGTGTGDERPYRGGGPGFLPNNCGGRRGGAGLSPELGEMSYQVLANQIMVYPDGGQLVARAGVRWARMRRGIKNRTLLGFLAGGVAGRVWECRNFRACGREIE